MLISTIFWIEAKSIVANGIIDNSPRDSNGSLQTIPATLSKFRTTHAPDESAQADAQFATGKTANDAPVKDLGVYGEVFPVQENSLLDVIKAKLQDLLHSGALSDHQNAISKKTKERLNRPEPVENVHKTVNPRSFAYDPSITVANDLKDHEGRVFHAEGTKVNPLDTRSLPFALLFVDGDDEAQVAWAISQFKAAGPRFKPKIILVKGAPFELSEKLGFLVYFDQSGTLIKKFGITQVPARVSQKEKILWVEEINPTASSLPLPPLKGEK